MQEVQPVLIGGKWKSARSRAAFAATNPQTRETFSKRYPTSDWADANEALDCAEEAFRALLELGPDQRAEFLEKFAERIEARSDEIVETAHLETALPVAPRLRDVELPRTCGQLRQAADAARQRSWCMATIDTPNNIRSYFAPLGPVAVFGPNNFPLAFNSIAGGDFAAAIAAGNPVIGKANTAHPGTTRCLAEEAQAAADDTGLPAGTVQLLYRLRHADGEKLVGDPRIGASGYTGSREAGLQLKAAADSAGKPIYLELSSINPVIMLPGALASRAEKLAEEYAGSCLMGTGQFCTNPGLVILFEGAGTEAFLESVAKRFQEAPDGTLLSEKVEKALAEQLAALEEAGAIRIAGGEDGGGAGFSHANTLLRVGGADFLERPEAFQAEAFGNAALLVVVRDVEEAGHVVERLEGNLTGCFYSEPGDDDALYARLEPALRRRVGRLLNDKMPTGVAVSPAMNHGGPFPATGHPGFTAVGIPASLRRFAMLQCYDQVRHDRLPVELQDANPTGSMWRYIDGAWTQDSVTSS